MREIEPGIRLGAMPVELRHVRDLIYFEGPLLSEFRGPDGDVYLYYWCDSDEKMNRWLVVNVHRHELIAYLVRRLPLRELIQRTGGFLFVVDIDGQCQESSVWLLRSKDIPQQYLPAPESFYSEPTESMADFEEIYIADSSILSDPSYFPRKYRDVYSYLACFGLDSNLANVADSVRYKFTTGYVFRTAFETLHQLLPANRQARLSAISAASPGYMRLSIDPLLGKRVRTCLDSYFANREQVRSICESIRGTDDPLDILNRSATQMRFEVSFLLGLDDGKLRSAVEDPSDASKLLRSFVERLESIYKQHKRGHVFILGLDRQFTPQSDEAGRIDDDMPF